MNTKCIRYFSFNSSFNNVLYSIWYNVIKYENLLKYFCELYLFGGHFYLKVDMMLMQKIKNGYFFGVSNVHNN